jgi:hypothetical protein
MTDEELKQLILLREINRKVSSQTWWSDLGSNLVGNAIWDGLLFIGTKIFRKL